MLVVAVRVEQMSNWVVAVDLEDNPRCLLPQTAVMLIYLHDATQK